MKLSRGLTLAVLASTFALQAACSSFSKNCHADGVCEITENGETRLEGPPAKVAQFKAKKAKLAKAEADRQKKIDAAPRRGTDEPVRIALIPVVGADQELSGLESKYQEMLIAELSKQPGFLITDHDDSRSYYETVINGGRQLSRFEELDKDKQPDPNRIWKFKLDKDTTLMARKSGVVADVMLYVVLSPKTKTGFVGQRGSGAGLAQVNLVSFDAKFSSLFNWKEHQAVAVGESASSLSVAGLGKNGKASAGALKGTRNVERDRAAVQQLAQQIHATVNTQIRGTLPALAALKDSEPQRSTAGETKIMIDSPDKAMDALKGLFGK